MKSRAVPSWMTLPAQMLVEAYGMGHFIAWMLRVNRGFFSLSLSGIRLISDYYCSPSSRVIYEYEVSRFDYIFFRMNGVP